MPSQVLVELGQILRAVAAREIMGRFQKLGVGDVMDKPSVEDPNDVVTLADRAAESALTEALPRLVPGSRVVGEEAVSADASLLELLNEEAPVWLVDPLDGTRNFAAGHGPFGSMVALVERGQLRLAAIYMPLREQTFLAEAGQGAFMNGQRIVHPDRTHAKTLEGSAYCRFMPEDLGARLERAQIMHRHGIVPSVVCAAHEYTEVAQGKKDYVVYHRLLPWDHAPGALLVREAGGVVRHPDDREYQVSDSRGPILLAPTSGGWTRSKAELFDFEA